MMIYVGNVMKIPIDFAYNVTHLRRGTLYVMSAQEIGFLGTVNANMKKYLVNKMTLYAFFARKMSFITWI